MPGVKGLTSVPWSDAEREQLRRMYENGLGPARIAQMIGRSKYSVHSQLKAMHLPRQRPVPDMTPRPPDRPRPAQPLRPGARTLPPLPSELNQ